ncbi:hypothetical protein CEXT_615921 [Caerostris extrusa]|uniref:Uncharacterized protein n=1 Tax=Caerostris extrusa TaxID=172846 RepID=A0AAV4SKE7_CAEEX|nr:hypothetical protein CEXT_615921 [Caerostris extrusa]
MVQSEGPMPRTGRKLLMKACPGEVKRLMRTSCNGQLPGLLATISSKKEAGTCLLSVGVFVEKFHDLMSRKQMILVSSKLPPTNQPPIVLHAHSPVFLKRHGGEDRLSWGDVRTLSFPPSPKSQPGGVGGIFWVRVTEPCFCLAH